MWPQSTKAAAPEASEQRETSESTQAGSRGELELGLSVALLGVGGGLIGFGVVQYVRAREHVEFCEPESFIDELDDPEGIDPCRFDPPSLGFASAGLSWGFAATMLVGSGLLMARGIRLQRRERARAVTLAPWWRRDGAGATLVWRF